MLSLTQYRVYFLSHNFRLEIEPQISSRNRKMSPVSKHYSSKEVHVIHNGVAGDQQQSVQYQTTGKTQKNLRPKHPNN